MTRADGESKALLTASEMLVVGRGEERESGVERPDDHKEDLIETHLSIEKLDASDIHLKEVTKKLRAQSSASTLVLESMTSPGVARGEGVSEGGRERGREEMSSCFGPSPLTK